MKTEEKTVTVYTTTDGKEFTDKKEAEAHEKALERITYVRVYHSPDLTEGRGFCAATLVKFNGKDPFMMDALIRDFCYRKWGRPVAFIQGCAATNAWSYDIVEAKNVETILKHGTRFGDYRVDIKVIEATYDRSNGFVEDKG